MLNGKDTIIHLIVYHRLTSFAKKKPDLANLK